MIAEIGEQRIGYDDSGSGHALVLLHGFPHDRTLWQQQRVALTSRARCVAIDIAGMGESSDPPEHSVDGYADDVMRLLDYLAIDRATIAGLSMGGYVALACWRRHPARVQALVLCDTKAPADTDEGRQKREDAIALVEREGTPALARAQISGMVGKRTRESNPAIVDGLLRMMERQRADAVINALRALRDRPDARDTVRSIMVPTLVIVGEHDVITPPDEARAIIEALPVEAEGQLEVIAGAGHASCIERPAAVTHALADFMAARSMWQR